MSAHSQAWPAKVTLCEVGLRDGLQNEKTIPSIEQKLQLRHLYANLVRMLTSITYA